MRFHGKRNLAASLLGLICLHLSTAVSSAQQLDATADRRYDALTWVQNAAEYQLLTTQIYRMALSQLSVGAHDPNWSADEVQLAAGGFQTKPPAIILDVDETVLDNSAYNARNIIQGNEYDSQRWNDWCQEARADAVPGALEFIKSSAGLGIKVFYVTNRKDVVKEATIKNLKELGFPVDEACLLTKNEEAGRGDDKVSRRAMIAENYRIVMLIGDSMSDLCTGMDVPNTKRRNEVAAEKSALLGSRWIMLPNPVYGGWQRALPAGVKALSTKMDALQSAPSEKIED